MRRCCHTGILTEQLGTGQCSVAGATYFGLILSFLRVLHELGGLLNANNVPFSPMLVPPKSMVLILKKLDAEEITRPTAKRLLTMVFDGDERSIDEIVEQENMGLHHLPREEYLAMAQNLLDGDPKKVWQIKEKKMEGKLKWFVGQMVRKGEGKVEAQKAEVVLKELLGLPSSPGAS